ncbi:hypothetical protein [Streptomyces collinus]|uniref:hypothetical protein n=1 Tax=Streptomyces collinus TaxID=42684 RepID=UPI00362F3BC0
MANWTQMHDCYGDVDRVPVLLERVELEDDADAWEELGYRLVLEHDLVFPASFAALPRLVRLAAKSTRARGLAGASLRRAAGNHGCDDLMADCADAIAEFRKLLERHLQSRPAYYLAAFLDSLAAKEEYHWSAVLGDFTDDFYHLAWPHCAVEVRNCRPRRARGPRRRNRPHLRPGRMPTLRQRVRHRGRVHIRQPPSPAVGTVRFRVTPQSGAAHLVERGPQAGHQGTYGDGVLNAICTARRARAAGPGGLFRRIPAVGRVIAASRPGSPRRSARSRALGGFPHRERQGGCVESR